MMTFDRNAAVGLMVAGPPCDEQVGSAATEEWFPRTMSELADFIVATHHAYLRRELPRLCALAVRLADAHGARQPGLREVRRQLAALWGRLEAHMDEEEEVLFPRIRRLQAGGGRGLGPAGAVSDAIRALGRDHEAAGTAVARLRALAGGYSPPADVRDAYRCLLGGLAELESDLRAHVHREDDVLFPRAVAAERAPAGPGSVSGEVALTRRRISDISMRSLLVTGRSIEAPTAPPRH